MISTERRKERIFMPTKMPLYLILKFEGFCLNTIGFSIFKCHSKGRDQ